MRLEPYRALLCGQSAEKAINDLLIFFAGSRLGSNGFVPAFVLYLGQTEAGGGGMGPEKGLGRTFDTVAEAYEKMRPEYEALFAWR